MPPRVRLESVWQHYYGEPLLPGKGWRRLRCPEHEDRTASAQVNTEDGRWTCFTCNYSEDALDIVMRKEGLGFGQAIRFVEDVIGETDQAPERRRRGGRRDAGDGQMLLGSRPRRRL